MDKILKAKAISDYVFASKYARYSKELKRKLTREEVVKNLENIHSEKYSEIKAE